MSTVHELKIVPPYFAAVFHEDPSCRKTFEFRKNDRNYQEGDLLKLREFIPSTETYTGREGFKLVTYVLTDQSSMNVPEGYAILGICDPEDTAQIICRVVLEKSGITCWEVNAGPLLDHPETSVKSIAGHVRDMARDLVQNWKIGRRRRAERATWNEPSQTVVNALQGE